MTHDDLATLERHAYARGDTEQARVLGLAADTQKTLENTLENGCLLEEARTSFPGEDCLEECRAKIEDILLGSRISKANIERIMELLYDEQTGLSNSAAYGREQINEYLNAITL